MALSVKHPFVSAIPDAGDATLVQPSNWNAAHTLTGIASVAQGGTGLATIAALSTWVANALDTPLVITPGAGQSIRINAGNTAWEAYTPAAAGATLTQITAATGAVTIASGDNTGIVWNWANTVNTTVAFQIGETTAATNGTSTSGVPNQVLFKLATLAASTQSPLSVYVRGTHALSFDPANPRVLGNSGSSALPTYGFAGQLASGLSYEAGWGTNISATGVAATFNSAGNIQLGNTAISFSAPQVCSRGSSDTTTGLSVGSAVAGIAISGVENTRWTAGVAQMSKGTADAVSYALNLRKSRGSVASPTVITTGDIGATVAADYYVGATQTFQRGSYIEQRSTGAISDSATGVGGIIGFFHAIVGAEPAEVGMFRSQHLIHKGSSPTITAGGGLNPTIVGKDEAFEVTIGTGGVATSVEVTFANAFTTNAPICVAQSDTDIVAFKCVTTTTKVTISATLAFTAGSILHAVCRGWE